MSRMDLSRIRDGLKEITYIRSARDAKGYLEKTVFLFPRSVGMHRRQTPVPPSLQIEPTNRCNLRCICCPVSRSSRKKGAMDLRLFRRIIDEASAVGVKRIHLYLHGEPLLHPDLVEMIRYIKYRSLFVNLVTHGMLFNEDSIRGILHAGVDLGDHIIFSVLGYSKDVHERIMKGIHHDRVWNNISSFVAIRKSLGMHAPILEIVFYSMPENKAEKDSLIRYWTGRVDHVRIVPKVSSSFRDYKKPVRGAPQQKKPCPNIWERMTVMWNGDVTICCADVDGEYVLGNLASYSIREIWNCEKLVALKNIHRKKEYDKHPLCASCDM
jgi:radical SAM protein with 4Fe4S-binding SPASM domain